MISDIRTKVSGTDVLDAIQETASLYPEISGSGNFTRSVKDYYEKEKTGSFSQEKASYSISGKWIARPLGCGAAEVLIKAGITFAREYTGSSLSLQNETGYTFDSTYRAAMVKRGDTFQPAEVSYTSGSDLLWLTFQATTFQAGDTLEVWLRMPAITNNAHISLSEAAEKIDDANSGLQIRAALVDYLKTLDNLGTIKGEGHFELTEDNVTINGYERKGSHGVTDIAFNLEATYDEAATVDTISVDLSNINVVVNNVSLSIGPAKDERKYNAVLTIASQPVPATVYIEGTILFIKFEQREIEAGTVIAARGIVSVKEA